MVFGEALRVIRRYPAILIACLLLSLVAGPVLVGLKPVRYQATSALIFRVAAGNSATELNQAATYLQTAMTTYTKLAVTPYVVDPVIEDLGLDQSAADLVEDVQVVNPTASVLLEISVTRSSPTDAADIANALAEQLAVGVQETSPSPGDSRSPLVKATIVEEAVAPTAPLGPPPLLLILGALLAGGVLATILLWILSIVDERCRPRDLAMRGQSVVGWIGRHHNPTLAGLLNSADEIDSPGSFNEQIRLVTQALPIRKSLNQDTGQQQLMLVTSAHEGEGKSLISLGIAKALADSGQRVLLVDANRWRAQLTAAFNLTGVKGLANIFDGSATADLVSTPSGFTNLDFISLGDVPISSRDFAAKGLRELLSASQVETVILDGPEVSGLSDCGYIAAACDYVLLAIAAGQTSRTSVDRAVGQLSRDADDRIMIVANKVAKYEFS